MQPTHDDPTDHGADDFDWDDSVPVQERLPLDEPIPYRLSPAGRRLVGDAPDLRVVGAHVDLDESEGTARIRARALRRAGAHTLDIAEELAVDALHVEAWVADLPVPAGASRARARRRLRVVADEEQESTGPAHDVEAAHRAATEAGRDEAVARLEAEPGLRSGLGLVAGALDPDPHALVLMGDQLDLLAAAWAWIRATLGAPTSPVRVLVRHEPGVAGDRTAHEVAAALEVDVERVATTRDAGRQGRSPLVRLRASDPELAGRVLGWQRALLAEVTHGAG